MDGLPRIAHLTLVALTVVLCACTTLTRLGAVPSEFQDEARPDGIPDVRFYPQQLAESAARLQVRMNWPVSEVNAVVDSDNRAGCDMLAISAGGDRGAFAAGLLSGWSQTGTRPRFRVVTGVSVGALIAPFAFLGPRYDHVLREVTLSAGPKSFFHRRSFLSGLLGDGFASGEPLERVLATYVTAGVLREIADEYRHGRDLYIMTTDLDAGVPVIWNMGAIAASESPDALMLFRQVMRASASIPVAVAPVLISVTAGGGHFQELHVDGSVTHQVFLDPFWLPQRRVTDMQDSAPSCRAFIIVNSQMGLSRSTTPPRTLRIGDRSIQTLMQVEVSNDVASIFSALQRQGFLFNLAYIDSDFQVPHPHDFDPSYMRALFSYGQRLGSGAYQWQAAPPQAQSSSRSANVNPHETLLLRCAGCSVAR
jgi:predicted acylesterase/phospholipase RssA